MAKYRPYSSTRATEGLAATYIRPHVLSVMARNAWWGTGVLARLRDSSRTGWYQCVFCVARPTGMMLSMPIGRLLRTRRAWWPSGIEHHEVHIAVTEGPLPIGTF